MGAIPIMETPLNVAMKMMASGGTADTRTNSSGLSFNIPINDNGMHSWHFQVSNMDLLKLEVRGDGFGGFTNPTATLTANPTINGNTLINGTTILSGATTVVGPTSITGNTTVNGNGTFTSDLFQVIKLPDPTGAIDLHLSSAPGVIPNGTYTYAYTDVTANGESLLSPASNPIAIIDNTINGQLVLLQIVISPNPAVIARNIYRSFNGGAYQYVYTIADNTTTSDQDNSATASGAPPTKNTTGNSYFEGNVAMGGSSSGLASLELYTTTGAPLPLWVRSNSAWFDYPILFTAFHTQGGNVNWIGSDAGGDMAINAGNGQILKLQYGNTVIFSVDSNGTTSTEGQIVKRTATAIDYSVKTFDYLIGVTSTAAVRTITLPTAANATVGKIYVIKDESGGAATHNIIIDGNGSETIDGALTQAITTNYGSVQLYTDGSNWFIY